MKIIKSPNDLPEWFKKLEYPRIKDPVNWCKNILRRIELATESHWPAYREVGYEGEMNPEESVSRKVDANDGRIKSIVRLVASPFKVEDIYYPDGSINELPFLFEVSVKIEPKPPVGDLDVWDVLSLAAVMPTEAIEQVRGIKKLIQEINVEYNNPKKDCGSVSDFEKEGNLLDCIAVLDMLRQVTCDRFHSVPIYQSLYAQMMSGEPCYVNLSLDDNTLMESFKRWVRNKRKARGAKIQVTKSPITEEVLNDWNRYKILQVFDIDWWCRMNGVKVTDYALAQFLWPDSEINAEQINPIERLRKVTRKKKIPEIISRDTFERLRGDIERRVHMGRAYQEKEEQADSVSI